MTGRDLQVLFCQSVEASGLSPVVPSRVVFDLLTRVREAYVEERLVQIGQNQSVREDLRPLVKTTQLMPVSPTSEYEPVEDRITLPTDYRYLLRAVAQTVWNPAGPIGVTQDKSAGDSVRVALADQPTRQMTGIVRVVETDDLARMTADPFNRSRPTDVVGYLEGGQLRLLSGKSFLTLSVFLTYIKNPAPITRDGVLDLSDDVLREIADRAAVLYKGERTRSVSASGAE
jgi:hypothetical protein